MRNSDSRFPEEVRSWRIEPHDSPYPGVMYGKFSHTRDTYDAGLSSLELSFKEKEIVNTPACAGVGGIAAGTAAITITTRTTAGPTQTQGADPGWNCRGTATRRRSGSRERGKAGTMIEGEAMKEAGVRSAGMMNATGSKDLPPSSEDPSYFGQGDGRFAASAPNSGRKERASW